MKTFLFQFINFRLFILSRYHLKHFWNHGTGKDYWSLPRGVWYSWLLLFAVSLAFRTEYQQLCLEFPAVMYFFFARMGRSLKFQAVLKGFSAVTESNRFIFMPLKWGRGWCFSFRSPLALLYYSEPVGPVTLTFKYYSIIVDWAHGKGFLLYLEGTFDPCHIIFMESRYCAGSSSNCSPFYVLT